MSRKRWAWLVSALVIAGALLAPGGDARAATGARKAISVDGFLRSYIVHVPSGYSPSRPTPVVLVLHGRNLTGEDMVGITGFNQEADSGGFLAVYPTSPTAWKGRREVTFIQQVLDALEADYNVDRARVFVAGVSAGGVFAYRLACSLEGRVAAVSVVAGIDPTVLCGLTRPISVLHIHGTADDVILYDGSGFVPSVSEVIARWRGRDGCIGAPNVTVSSPNGTRVTKESATPCRQGSEVTLYTVQDGPHTWFGFEDSGPGAAVDATSLSWQFFRAHPMP